MAKKPYCEGDLFCGVNEPRDTKEMSDLEKKHTPVIDCPEILKKGSCNEVTVEVGKLMPHPNETGHFIQWVELYADDTFLGRADLTAILTCPRVKFCINLGHAHEELRAFVRCNLHGLWQGTKKVKVQ